jgi:hypothetical protein
MKTYKITTPNTMQISSHTFTHKGTKAEALSYALWAYNSARAHDGLEPLEKLPRGTVCKSEGIMSTFRFDTGVKAVNSPKGIPNATLSSNGVYVIPFECEAPKGATFLFACDYDNLPDGTCYPIKQPSPIISKFAYFKV